MTVTAAWVRKAAKVPSTDGDLGVAIARGNFAGTAGRIQNAQFAVCLGVSPVIPVSCAPELDL
jgi:hypothetical protein